MLVYALTVACEGVFDKVPAVVALGQGSTGEQGGEYLSACGSISTR